MTPDAELPALICELCRQFYGLGWVSGTGGGISVRGEAGVFMAPSGVQKERIAPQDVFVLDGSDLSTCTVVKPPANPNLRVSECQPLFYNAFRMRDAGAVLHSHSVWAVLAARLFSPGGEPATFECQGLEMQKGLRGKGCFDTVRVPIIANTPREAQLTESMADAIEAHPDVDAVLVAGHGVYVWGETWVKAKTQAECLDYLFRATVELHRLGLAGDAR
ncbi:MAG: methylthioribulose 1-phosphate dehydratase [Nannocystaceae bacterium]|nr:methylthioribulose 1-phosphate dehydratase [bacterium]